MIDLALHDPAREALQEGDNMRKNKSRSGIQLTTLLLLVGLLAIHADQSMAQNTFDLYLIDVEGGGATLFVAPSGEALLIDTGNGGVSAPRDMGRIVDAMQDANVTEIDYLITTHWHGDHYGAMAELASQVTVHQFIDHGPTVESSAAANEFINTIYPEIYGRAERRIVVPGDKIELADIEFTVLTAAKQVIDRALPSGGLANPYCADFTPQNEDNGENAQSVGVLAQFGDFRVLHLGDLTWNTEFQLMCPRNPIGTVDLFVVSHHGQPSSNSALLVHAVEPRVAIMNNGTRKGGQPDAMQILHSAPVLEDLWQLHFSELSGQQYTVPGLFIANTVDEAQSAMLIAPRQGAARGPGVEPAPRHNGEAHWLKVSSRADGSFTVTNSRNDFSKTYRER